MAMPASTPASQSKNKGHNCIHFGPLLHVSPPRSTHAQLTHPNHSPTRITDGVDRLGLESVQRRQVCLGIGEGAVAGGGVGGLEQRG